MGLAYCQHNDTNIAPPGATPTKEFKMKRFPKILVATCAALALTSSLALAAEPAVKKTKAVPAPAAAMAPMGQMGGMGQMGMMGGGMGGGMGQGKGMMSLASLSPEKQEVAKALMNEYRDALFPLHQSMYAKGVELEALNAAGSGDSDKARAVIRDIADLNAKMLIENGKFRTRMIKETGLRTPLMGHGMMGGGMMGGHGGGKMGMMGGNMNCAMMESMGGMQHGAMAPVKGAPAPAGKAAPAPAHDAHGN
jgi:Spy/CpxP family protein refolding chaperone